MSCCLIKEHRDLLNKRDAYNLGLLLVPILGCVLVSIPKQLTNGLSRNNVHKPVYSALDEGVFLQ